MLKILPLILALIIATPAFAADAPKSDATPAKAQTDSAKGDNNAKDAKDAKSDDKKEEKTPEKKPNEFFTPYYEVTLPDGWKATKAPVEEQGLLNAIFESSLGDTIVSMLVGPTGGADAKTIAELFSEQFKAPKPPVEKKGQFTFTFPRQDSTASAWVAVQGKEFMVTTITGDVKTALAFIQKNIVSKEYPDLLPK